MKEIDTKETYYGILMHRSIIDGDVYLFKPMCMLEGKLSLYADSEELGESEEFEELEEDLDVFDIFDMYCFLDLNEDSYFLTESTVGLDNSQQSVAYYISESELKEKYPSLNIKEAKKEYYDDILSYTHIGFYDSIHDKIDLQKFNLLSLLNDLNKVDCSCKIESRKFEPQNGKEMEIALEVDESWFRDVLQSKTLEEMKTKVQKVWDGLVDTMDSVTKEKMHIDLFYEACDKLMQDTDINEIKAHLHELADFYMECKNILDRHEQTTAICDTKDFLVHLINEWNRVAQLATLSEIQKEIINIKKREEANIQQFAKVYSIVKGIYEEDSNKDSHVEETINVREAKAFLDARVIGQEEATKAAISLYVANSLLDDPRNKTSCLLIGPTGSGKTLIPEVLGEYLNKPFVKVDITNLTVAGYVGDAFEDYLGRLLVQAGGDLEKAQEGIILFDEIDKKGSANNSDISGKGVLNQLLSFTQGATYKVRYNHKTILFDTSKLNVYATGSFMEAIKAKEEKGYSGGHLGFVSPIQSTADEDIAYEPLTHKELSKYGNIPMELVGRFPKIIQLSGHTIESLVRILTDSKLSVLLAEKEIMRKLGADLRWTEGFLLATARKAMTLETGARSLKATIEMAIDKARWEVMYNPKMYSAIILTESTVLDNENCTMIDSYGNSYLLKDILASQEKIKDTKRKIKK